MDAFDALLLRDFPYLQERTFLDTATTSLAPPNLGENVSHFFSAKRRGTGGKAEWTARSETVRARLATLLNVAPETVYYLSSTTEALNLVAHSIRWEQGDEIVLAADEFPSVIGCWDSASLAGARVIKPQIEHESEREETLLRALTNRTRALAVSHVHFATGTRLNLERLGSVCRANGTLLVVDGIQALGAIPVSLANVDIYCAGTFKWMLGGYGLAVLTVSDAAAPKLHPAYRGPANPAPSRSLNYSHINYPGIYALEAALNYLDDIGWQTVWSRVAALTERLISGLGQLGHNICAPPNARAGIVSFPSPNSSTLCSYLNEARISVADRRGLVRASPHFYNRAEDIDRYLTAVSEFSA